MDATRNSAYAWNHIIDKLSKKWSMFILNFVAGKKCVRFSEILEALPDINSRILSERLSELEKAQLITRTVKSTKPIVVHYAITERGQDLKPIFKICADWSKKWCAKCR